MALGHDIRHAQHFKDCAHRTTSNDAGTLWSGRHHHDSGAMVARDVVIDGAVPSEGLKKYFMLSER